jgi:limonene-1,2-epoxide hydrolase
MLTSEEQLIEKFYTAFANKDAAAMASCYADDVEFEDPAFGKLKGSEAVAMWTMLVSRSKDLHITFSDISANSAKGDARWLATYTFSRTGRKVINQIHANFEFANGKIIKHKDSFDLNKWFKMAFGLKGYLFIGLPFLRKKFKNTIRQSVLNYMAKRQ